MKEYEDVNDCVMEDWKELEEEREIDNCLIMRIKKLKEQVKNLIQQVIGSCILAFTKNKKEKRITELEKENAELNKKIEILKGQKSLHEGILWNDLHRLEKENAELKEQVNILENCDRLGDTITEAYKEQHAQAKEIIKNIIRVTWCEGWNYSLDVKVKAEQFLKEIE